MLFSQAIQTQSYTTFDRDQDDDLRALVFDLAEAVSRAYSETSMKKARDFCLV